MEHVALQLFLKIELVSSHQTAASPTEREGGKKDKEKENKYLNQDICSRTSDKTTWDTYAKPSQGF